MSDGFSLFTIIMTVASILLPMAFLSASRPLTSWLTDSQLNWVTLSALIITYVLRSVATFGALWALLAVARWAARSMFKRPAPLGHSVMVMLAGAYGLWFVPGALIGLQMTSAQQMMFGTYSCMALIVVAQLCRRYWPQVRMITEAAD
ncbi:hypothetical protein EDF62_3280 [Leucobacter luti]|uniref:Uncharacterized protein n=1 Tax=Leucobacter luti TaxID=340320 RepID=A0A4R6RRR5_9MICO|nr:hypothetical protein [Leucobacter luti]TDP89549.1 hypothetical protein EDF62_3280 [Leucobacter luti]